MPLTDAPFTVAIVGRPNVGKSTLFNRLVGRREALVDDRPGVTRDRRTGIAGIGGVTFTVIDTAGLEEAVGDTLEARMRRQTERAVAEADVALLLIDARAGVTPVDRHFADLLRRSPTPVLLVANKCEGRAGDSGLLEAYALGLGEPIPVSAAHGEGMADLLEALLPHIERRAAAAAEAEAAPGQAAEGTAERRLRGEAVAEDAAEAVEAEAGEAEAEEAEPEPDRGPIQLAIVGRPNVGKSTLVNALIGDERVLTGPEPGVTRDAIAVDWTWRDRAVRLVDTAGLRRRARIEEPLERLSVGDTLNAIRLANVVVLVLDAAAILEKQDLTIARHVVEEGRALVIAVNKWDQVTDPAAARRQVRDRLETSLAQVPGVPVVTVSALKGRNLDRLMDAVLSVYDIWKRRISTGRLNRWLGAAVEAHPPPVVKGRRLKLRYMTQLKARPPTFAIWTSRPEELPDSYMRYLVNGLRETFDLPGVPMRVVLRKGKNPYADD